MDVLDVLPFKADAINAGPCPACEVEGTRKRYDPALRVLIIECANCSYPWFAMQPAFMQEGSAH